MLTQVIQEEEKLTEGSVATFGLHWVISPHWTSGPLLLILSELGSGTVLVGPWGGLPFLLCRLALPSLLPEGYTLPKGYTLPSFGEF